MNIAAAEPLFNRRPNAVTPNLPFADYQALPGINASILKEATPFEMLSKLEASTALPTLERQLLEMQSEGVATALSWMDDFNPRTVPRPFIRLAGAVTGKTTDSQEAIIARLLTEGEVDAREFNTTSINSMEKKGWVETVVKEVEEVGASDNVTAGRLQSFAIGDALHKSILEPHLFDSANWHKYWQLCPTKSLNSGAAKELREADPTRALITPEIIDAARMARDAVQKHDLARELLSLPGQSELTMECWDEEFQIMRKCRMDRLPDDHGVGILDIKTTRAKLLAQPFKGEVYKLGYHTQLAYYADTAKLIEGKDRGPRYIIAVTNHAPFICRVFDLAEALPDISLIAKGRDIYLERLAAFVLAFNERNFEAYEHEGAFALTA